MEASFYILNLVSTLGITFFAIFIGELPKVAIRD